MRASYARQEVHRFALPLSNLFSSSSESLSTTPSLLIFDIVYDRQSRIESIYLRAVFLSPFDSKNLLQPYAYIALSPRSFAPCQIPSPPDIILEINALSFEMYF